MNKSTSTIRTYKYLLKPSAEQQAILNEMLRTACDLYNHARQHRIDRWKQSRHSITYNMQAKLLTVWRNEDKENNSLHTLGVVAAQQVLRRLDRAYRDFFKGIHGYPKFKLYRFFNSLNWPYGAVVGLRNGKLRIQNVGLVPIRWYRPLLDSSTLKNIIVKRQNGRWWVHLQIETVLEKLQHHKGLAIGIDVGLHHALALSDGTLIDSPRYLQRSLKKLRYWQRVMARRKKGSHRRRKAAQQVAKLYERVANQRRNWWHEVTRWLVENYSVVVLEDLNLSFMLRNKHLARAAHDVGLGIFYELLTYKTIEVGSRIEFVNAAYTSQTCPGCGDVVSKKLGERVHSCVLCGYVADRDVAAAQIILSRSSDDRQALTWSVETSVA